MNNDRVEAIQEWASDKSWFDSEVVDGIEEWLGRGLELTTEQDIALDNIISGFKIPYNYPLDLWSMFKEQVGKARPLLKIWLEAADRGVFSSNGLKIVFSGCSRMYASSLRRHVEVLELELDQMNIERAPSVIEIIPHPLADEEQKKMEEYEIGIEECVKDLEWVLEQLKNCYAPDQLHLGVARWVEINQVDLCLKYLVNWLPDDEPW